MLKWNYNENLKIFILFQMFLRCLLEFNEVMDWTGMEAP